MNSLVKVFSNFKEFYSEINGATLTGAIDVIVVEQPDGEFQCSPFHVRFGKLGVLRSREKVVDIEINGEPVDIHMKLGESGEAFFVEELCPEDDIEELPDNLATSPIPSNYTNKFTNESLDDEVYEPKSKNASEEIQMPLPLPRRNSIDFSKEVAKDEAVPKFENQAFEFTHRRHTDNVLERPNLNEKLKEYTTQKLRQEWAEHEEIFSFESADKENTKEWSNSTQSEERPEQAVASETTLTPETANGSTGKEEQLVPAMSGNFENVEQNSIKDDGKSGKKKRRKKSQMKKKNAQRKSSSSSSLGSLVAQDAAATAAAGGNPDEGDGISVSISNNTNSSSNDELTPRLLSSGVVVISSNNDGGGDDSSKAAGGPQTTPPTPTSRKMDLDIHFFSDTEVTSSGGPCGAGRGAGRPSTPIQSDSELEISLREKDVDMELMSSTASWKWGELPTPEHSEQKNGSSAGKEAHAQAQRNSTLSGMFNFMKKTNKMRKQGNDGGMYLSELDGEGVDPEMVAMYFPTVASLSKEAAPLSGALHATEDDRESGNGTSLPHSPSSMEGQKSSLDSDYEENAKPGDAKYLDFVAMSLCGVSEKGEPSDQEFDRHLIKYSDVCENPSLFASPNLIVRLNGKYYSWVAACPIVMTIITFQKPLTSDAIEQLITNAKQEACGRKNDAVDGNSATGGQAKRSWWYWRRSGGAGQNANNKIAKGDPGDKVIDDRDADQAAVATQTTRPNSPDVSDNTLSKTDSTLNAENTSAMVENLEDLSMNSTRSQPYTIANVDFTPNSSSKDDNNSHARNFKKSLRLSSEAIKQLDLKDGMNEIEFSVTTAYQGTTRCKCYLFRWKHSDKVVISDIDGTITKSDVLGHILPMVGKDWAQLGVAQLFSKIEQNGYKLLYLSARAIGQSRATREYLRSITQGNTKLPDGPLLLNPTSLISAFHREVIERKPEQFKIACLSDIRDLFPDKNPFYAGYGNRINDVWAYRAVGIPIMRIFTINTKGELKHELTQTFQSSYCSMTLLVDQLFPPIKADEGSIEFSNFNYWRDPIADVDLAMEHADALVAASAAATAANESNNIVELAKPLTTIPEN